MQSFFFSSVIVLSDFPASFPSAFLILLFRLSFSCMPFFLLLLMLSCHFRHLAMIVQAPFSIGSSSALCQTLHSGFHEINRLNRRLCGFFSMTDSCPEYAVLKVTLQSFLNLWMAETGFSLNPFSNAFLLSGHFFVHPAVQVSPMEAFASFHPPRLLPGCVKPVFKRSTVRILFFRHPGRGCAFQRPSSLFPMTSWEKSENFLLFGFQEEVLFSFYPPL